MRLYLQIIDTYLRIRTLESLVYFYLLCLINLICIYIKLSSKVYIGSEVCLKLFRIDFIRDNIADEIGTAGYELRFWPSIVPLRWWPQSVQKVKSHF